MSPASSAPPQIQPGCEAFAHDGGPVGVLVLHGFTGSPFSVRPWAEHLAAAGFTVRAPRLPGHGTSWRDLATTTWTDWYTAAEEAFAEISSRCALAFVAGLSMGGCLALRLAEVHGPAVRGVVLVNPSLAADTKMFLLAPVLKHVVPSLPGVAGDLKKPGADERGYARVPVKAAATLPAMWKATAAGLSGLTQPLLVYRSTIDHVVGPNSMRVLREALPEVEVRQLDDSYHVATLDNDAPVIFGGTVEWITKHAMLAGGQHGQAEVPA